MSIEPRPLRLYGIRDIDRIPQLKLLSEEDRFGMKVVAHVLPFRVNGYVLENLIDWDRVPDDPIFRLTFPLREMLRPDQFDRMARLVRDGAPPAEREAAANEIRADLNPHPAGQGTANVPELDGETVPGVQHKYRETVLVFPSNGQTCHIYCTFCFRWPQFVGTPDLRFATDESERFQEYIRRHSEIQDVLVTGGDPMIMGTRHLRRYVEPLLGPGFEHVQTIRIGTKSVATWPHRFVTDRDADDVLRLFDQVVRSGKHLAVMAHYNHWRELSTDVAREAIGRVRSTGAVVRSQSPLLHHINDDADVWARMWKEQVRQGIVPYYMFVERDTGAREYFQVPLARAFDIFRGAILQTSGLGRTVRGPSMSALPGKVVVEGMAEIRGEKVFVLKLLQARNPEWCRRPFFAKFDPKAAWLDDLTPAFEREFFYEPELREMLRSRRNSLLSPDPS